MSPNHGLGVHSSHLVIKPCSRNHFVGLDNALEFTIVTVDGSHVIANAYNNQDLFWALRGGGGGTWSVVTSVSYKTHPSAPLFGALLGVISTSPDSNRKLLAEIIRLTPSLIEEQGYGGYLRAGSNFWSCHPTSLWNKPTPLSFPCSNLLIPNQVSLIKTLPSNSQIFRPSTKPCSTPAMGKSDHPSRFRPGCYLRMSSQTDKPEDLAAELLKMETFGCG